MTDIIEKYAPPTGKHPVRIYWIIAAIIGAFVAVIGFLAAIAVVIFVPVEDSPAGLFAVCMLGVVMGVAVIWAAIRGLRNKPGKNLFSKFGWLIWLLVMGALLGSSFLLPDTAFMHWAFGFVHLAATLSAAFLVISLVVRFTGVEKSLNWRQAITGMAGGASGVLVALPVELVGLFLSAFGLVMIAQLIPGGSTEIERVMAILQEIPYIFNIADAALMEVKLTMLLSSPLVIGTLLLGMSVITPFIEEFGKVLVLLFVWKADQPLTSQLDARGRLARAFLWGAVCGLGFAIVEGVFSGASALTGQGSWAEDVLIRLLATTMHVFVSGLVGLGWGMAREYKWWWLPIFYLGAVVLHGIWNANALITVWATAIEADFATTAQIVSTLGIVVQVLLSLLSFGAVIAIPALLNRRPKPVE